jgi:hypothetical protein
VSEQRTGYEIEVPFEFDSEAATHDERVAYLDAIAKCKPGAVVTFPDGNRYRVARKSHRSCTCEASGTLWRVMKLTKLEDAA